MSMGNQYPSNYDEFNQQHAPPPGAAALPVPTTIGRDNVRPSIDGAYYHTRLPVHHQHQYDPHQVSHHHPQHHQYQPEHQLYHPHPFYPNAQQQQHLQQHYTSTPSALATSAYSLKRKTPAITHPVTPSGPVLPMHGTTQQICDICHHPDPILSAPPCGHIFHSRCVHVWPLEHCPVCDVHLSQVSVLRLDMNAQIDTRSGKWTRAEEKFIEAILTEFDRSSFPLANGTPVRLLLAKLLNCSTMRLSKKFQKNALGKRTFRIVKPAKGEFAMEFKKEDHVMRQKEFSRFESIFRHELVEQYRRENNTDEGAYVETHDLRRAVQQFWVSNFLKFAVMIGQPVQRLDISDAKKKKQALLMLRNGQYDDLLGWHGSPMNTPTISPLPTETAREYPAWERSESGESYTSPRDQPSGVGVETHQPMKKMRTPESITRSTHYGIQAPPDAGTATYSYGKISPHVYNQAEHQVSHYVTGVPTRHSPTYGDYPIVKESKPPMGYSAPPHTAQQQSQGQQPVQVTPTNYDSVQGVPPLQTYRPSGVVNTANYQTHHTSGVNPWEELLEDMSESNAQVVDPSLQAWSNLHIM